MEIFHNSPTRKMEKKEQMSFDDDNKRDGARSENRLMKQIKIKNELLKKAEKKEKGKKSYREHVKSRMGEYYESKPYRVTSKFKKKKLGKAVTPTEEDEPLGRKKPRVKTTGVKHP